MLKKLFISFMFGIFLISFASASYTNTQNFTIYPSYDAFRTITVNNNSNTINVASNTGLGAHSIGYVGFANNSNGTYDTTGLRITSISFNFTINSATSGILNATSNVGINITNDVDFSSNITNMQLKGVQYALQNPVTANTNYRIDLGARGVSDWNNNSVNGTFGIFLPDEPMTGTNNYRMNSSESNASQFRPNIFIVATCEPPVNSDWIIDGVNCVVTSENIAMSTRNTILKNGGNLTLLSGTNITGTGWFNQAAGSYISQDTTSSCPWS